MKFRQEESQLLTHLGFMDAKGVVSVGVLHAAARLHVGAFLEGRYSVRNRVNVGAGRISPTGGKVIRTP